MIQVIGKEESRLWKKKSDRYRIAGWSVAAKTDIGLKRTVNQDRYTVRSMDEDTLLAMVADGLGGDPGGQTAAQYVVDCADRVDSSKDGGIIPRLLAFFNRMDRDLGRFSDHDERLDGMATTLIAVAVKNSVAHWVHSGDSRFYHIRKQGMEKITEDQTLDRFLVREGELSREEAKTHYSAQILDQCIGCRDLEPECGIVLLEPEDILVLASDGLCRHVPDETIKDVCRQSKTAKQAADNLVRCTLDGGGHDNVTVAVIKNAGEEQC